MANFISRKKKGKGWGPVKNHAMHMTLNGVSEVDGLDDYRSISLMGLDRRYALSLTNREAIALINALQKSLERKPI